MRLTVNEKQIPLKLVKTKNKKAKNYFTCNDTSINNLGFIEFTDITYQNETLDNYSDALISLDSLSNATAIAFDSSNIITIASTSLKTMFLETTKDSLPYYVKKCDTINGIILLNFQEDLSFQNYIDYKSIIEKTDLKQSKISLKEFIFN